jgi:uroporphyrinogen-III synthase
VAEPGDRPLAGRRIVLTRPDPGALADHLAELGAEVVHVPLISISAPADGGVALRRALARVDAFDWVVVTSVNGARAVGAAVARHPRVRLAAVGPATGAVLAELAGRPVDLVAQVPRAEGLVAEFPGHELRVLIAQADRAGPTVAEGLAARGHFVETVTAYSTVDRRPPPDELALLNGVDAVVFASGSAVESWVAVRGQVVPPVVVVIGPKTERVARRVGVAVTKVAESPGPAGVGAALLAAWRA